MSRSRRKTPIRGIAGDSDKEDKRIANRRYRSKVKQILNGYVGGYLVLPKLKEVSNVWDFTKDGKRYVGYANIDKPYMRK